MSINNAKCSNGQLVDEVLWSSNQIVDLLAKEAADVSRVLPDVHKRIMREEVQIKQLAVYLGKPTYEVNHHRSGPDCPIERDSEAVRKKAKAKPKIRAKAKPKREERVVSRRENLSSPPWTMPRPAVCVQHPKTFLPLAPGVAKQRRLKLVRGELDRRNEASFFS